MSETESKSKSKTTQLGGLNEQSRAGAPHSEIDRPTGPAGVDLDGADFSWDRPKTSEGDHELQIEARDKAGNQTVIVRRFPTGSS